MKRKRERWVFCGILVLLLVFYSEVSAKSVFAVASHSNGKVKAYKIDSNGGITFQGTITNPMAGATGLTTWPSKDRLFVTYEEPDIMSWASLRTLTRIPQADDSGTGTEELGGMTASEEMGILYAIQRGSNYLFGFDYDVQTNKLIPVQLGNGTSYQLLTDVGGGIDIDIDPQGSQFWGLPVGRLYASDQTPHVRYYNMQTWQYEGELVFQRNAIGLGIDTQRGYLYAGEFDGGGGHSYLMRMNLDGNPNSYIEKYMGYTVMDIAVDEDTGLIYLTGTNNNNYSGRTGSVAVYNPLQWTASDPNSLVLVDIENDGDFIDNGPGGIGIGLTYKEERGFVEKVDDVDESTDDVLPNEVFHYYIMYRPDIENETNVVVTDFLPDGVDFISADPNWGTYYPQPEHKYVWQVGNVPGWTPDPNDPSDPNYYFSLTVRVNTLAEPATNLENIVEVESDEALTIAKAYTPVGWWGGDSIYVKWDATGADIGTDWTNAYRTLRKGLERAAKAPDPNAVEVRVARGTYKPGVSVTDTFKIPNGIEVYGGWLGDPANPTERNVKLYETILSGLISDSIRNRDVITMGALTLLDGVTVKESGGTPGAQTQGILGQNVNFTVSNCSIIDNQRFGIRAENGSVSIERCDISGNGFDGVYYFGSNSRILSIENCRIFENKQHGINARNTSLSILNSVISFNGSDSDLTKTYYGVYVFYPFASPAIKNCSIVCNVNEGLYFTGFGTNYPSIRNCILWGNKGNGLQLDGYRTAYYSCVYDPNHPNQTTPDTTYYNISCNPLYACNGDPNVPVDHLLPNSPCIDRGDPYLSYSNQSDIDNETRVLGTYVEMGADEIDPQCDEIYNVLDWNWDGLVNLDEFNVFSRAWKSHNPIDPALTDPNYPMYPYYNDPNSPYYVSNSALTNWNPQCNLSTSGLSEYAIDLDDLLNWIGNSWLWTACWRTDILQAQQQQQSMMIGMTIPEFSVQSNILTQESSLVDSITTQLEKAKKSPQQQLVELEDAAKWLEDLWLNELEVRQSIDEKSWNNFMNSVHESLDELKTINANQPLNESEALQ